MRRSWRFRALVLIVVLAALWSAGWYGAAEVTGRAMDTWMTGEASAGRQWTCPDRQVEGFPFALRVTCRRPTFRGEVAGHTADGIIEGMNAGIDLARPTTLAIAIRGPLNLRAEDDAFMLEVSWAADLDLSVPDALQGPTGGALAANRVAFSLSVPGEGDVNLRAAALSGQAAVASAPADKRFNFDADGVSFPTLDPIPGLEGPMTLAGQGVLVGATLLQAPTVARLEAWRVAGGALDLEALRLSSGSFSGTAKGHLALDAEHRPAGRLDTVLVGFEPIARRYGIPVGGVQLGGLLTSLLSGGKTAPAPKGSVSLPLILADGQLSVGPFPTALRLPPLY